MFKEHLLPSRPRRRNRLVYISRAGATQRRLLNEDEMVECVKSFGFDVFRLEDLSFSEQIDLFYDARCVIGLHGAGFVNVLFTENADVIELFSYRYAKPTFYLATKAAGGRHHYVTAEGEEINVDVRISVEKVSDILRRIDLQA